MITKYDTSKLLENLISKDSRFTFGLIGIMHAYNDSNGNSNLCDAILSKFRGTEKILRETIKLYDINAMHLYEKYIDIVTKEDMIDYYQIQINS